MKIRTKLILNYSILSIILLFIFSIIVTFSYIRYRQHDFQFRLHNRASSSANMLLNENDIDSTTMRLIDRNIITALGDLQISIYDQNRKKLYSNTSSSIEREIIAQNRGLKGFIQSFELGLKTVSFNYSRGGQVYLIRASAIDNYGKNELNSLLNIIIWVLGFSVILIIGFGFYNALWSLRPFKKIIHELETVDPSSIEKRISVQGTDEISQLAKSFNTLMDRIEQAFETEKSFISNASHELRTPVTSVLGQIEVALNIPRSSEEYKSILQSVYEDTMEMATIINGFLELAETNLANNTLVLSPVRIDELIFGIVEDFTKRKPAYTISVDFNTNPETDKQLECLANDRLLRLMFNNLIDNACKYSSDKKAKVMIYFSKEKIVVSIIDHGIGINSEDSKNIFKPLYRGRNSAGKPGHGIGLAIVKRIADLHNAKLEVKSELNFGTTVTVIIKI